MGKTVNIINAISALLSKILPKSCKSKCCSGSECECGNKNIIDSNGELEEDEATIQAEEIN